MDATRPPAASVYRRQARLRGAAAGILSVLATLFLVASALTVWGHALLLDTDHWVATLGPLAADPAIDHALGSYLAGQIVTAIGVPERVGAALPRQPQIGATVTSAIRDRIAQSIEDGLASGAFQSTWVALNRAAHAELVSALRGNPSSYLSIRDDTLWLDLSPLLARATNWVQQRVPGLSNIVQSIPPDTNTEDIQSARQDLAGAFGRNLPPDFGQVAILTSDRMPALQWAARALDTLFVLLPLAALALSVCAVALANDHARMLAVLGAEVALAFLLILAAMETIVSTVAVRFGDATTLAAVEAIVRALMTNLVRLDVLGIVAGVLAALAGVFMLVRRRPALPQAGSTG